MTIAEIPPERQADRKLTGVREGLPTTRPEPYLRLAWEQSSETKSLKSSAGR
jgi:hypothetical protein